MGSLEARLRGAVVVLIAGGLSALLGAAKLLETDHRMEGGLAVGIGLLPALLAAVLSYRRVRFAAPAAMFTLHAIAQFVHLNLYPGAVPRDGDTVLRDALGSSLLIAAVALTVNICIVLVWIKLGKSGQE